MKAVTKLPYILESNPHPFYSFRGLRNEMRITVAGGLDSRSRAGFWKNDKAAVRAVRTIQYNNLLFYLLLIIIYYSSDSPSSLINESLSVLSTQSLSSLSSTSSSHTMSFLDPFKDLTIVLERSDDSALRDGFPCSQHPPRDFWRSCAFDFSSFC